MENEITSILLIYPNKMSLHLIIFWPGLKINTILKTQWFVIIFLKNKWNIIYFDFFSHNHISIHLDVPIRVTHFLGQLTSSQSPDHRGPPGPPSGSYRWCQPQGRKDKPPGMQPAGWTSSVWHLVWNQSWKL